MSATSVKFGKSSSAAAADMPTQERGADLGEVEAADPRPPWDFRGVEVHWVVVVAGNGLCLQECSPGNLSIDDLYTKAISESLLCTCTKRKNKCN